jgi:CRP/FNR family cyclic AMP-dependent transcriptional regulator
MENAIENFLDDSPLFADLSEVEKAVVEEHMYEMHLDPDEILFRETDPGDFVCFVVSGTLQVLKQNESGEMIELAVLGRGQSIGEMGMIDNTTRFATVKAQDDAVLMVLTRKGFDLLLAQYPPIGIVILRTLARLMSEKIRELSHDFMEFYSR